MNSAFVIFDLDDTLYKEIDYLTSAYDYISGDYAKQGYNKDTVLAFMLTTYYGGSDVFSNLLTTFPSNYEKTELIELYRTHFPNIVLSQDAIELLEFLKENHFLIGLITDGRSFTQRNKIRALDLSHFISDSNIIISEEFGSEKPDIRNYIHFVDNYPAVTNFIYVGDNPQKDFVTPNSMGWLTIGLRNNGRNIHSQCEVEPNYEPAIWVHTLVDLIPILKRI